jgi:hypothetical protein
MFISQFFGKQFNVSLLQCFEEFQIVSVYVTLLDNKNMNFYIYGFFNLN